MKKRILIIEDEPLILFTLSSGLKSEVVEIVTASTGAEVSGVISGSAPFDLYFVDKTLPDKDGFDLVKDIRSRQSEVPVVIMTGRYRSKQDILEHVKGAAGMEPFHFITKPFDIEQIRELVFNILFT